MPANHRAELARIKNFRQLVAYLRDEMGWPIDSDDFEELVFEYTPEELGIDRKNAAKIEVIRRLRPLAANQPWGIFFVRFEPKKLPVLALRRILGQVALKKRASANRSERQAWAADDLLFVSNYGEGEERQISFAHFSRATDGQDLPTLKVLGWNNLDTALHLDAVAHELHEHLAWPEDESNTDAWRDQWRAAFTLRHREVITTAKELSIRLAALARDIRDRITTALAIENEKGPLTKLMEAFRTSLVHDLDAAGFADMYAQTIAYGLLSARIADPHGKTVDDFAAHMRTNPFLRELMETFLKVGGRRGRAGGPGIDFDELGVSEVVQLLDDANMEAVVRDFGDRNPQEDPVIHFYEHFLKEYDKKQKVSRGVFYTPRPVVSYIVRSVDELLRTEFGLEDGLADTASWREMAKRHKGLKIPEGVSPDQDFVQILDPATGTGTFLVEVIDLIYRTLVTKWKAQGHGDRKIDSLWNEYVPKHLLTRLHGYELLMAPYAIAHLKIGLKLYETGYRFGSHERARVYLTNALEPAQDFSGRFEFAVPALAHEAQAVNTIKENRRFTVVIGNPPYSNFGKLNRIPFILNLLGDYKRGLNEKKLNLDDDFIKFVRFSQHLLDLSGSGMLGMITSSTYLDGVTHRRMRESLADSFSRVSVLDLHGSSKRQETNPTGRSDENVFDIQTGVAISLMTKQSSQFVAGYAELWGSRPEKYNQLDGTAYTTTAWVRLAPETPYWFLRPKEMESCSEYQAWPTLKDVFQVSGCGIKTERDRVSIHWSAAECREAVEDFRTQSEGVLRKKYGLTTDSRDWKVANAKADVRKNRDERLFHQILYRPFDVRHIWYSGQTRGFVGTPGYPTMRHLLDGKNLALLTCRQQAELGFHHTFCTRLLAECCSVSLKTREITSAFPLYLAPQDEQLKFTSGRVPAFSHAFLRSLCGVLGVKEEKPHGLPNGLTPEDIFHYAYAVFHCPGYRIRYAEFLKIDFPRLPLTGSIELFRVLARLGSELTALHLLESPKLDKPIADFIGARIPEVAKVSWSKDTVWIDKTLTTGFKGVCEDVWNFHIGGYQVCNKWLKDRKGRTLSKDDIAHYQKIIVALSETIRLMKEIDEVIEQHGGWPGAFVIGEASEDAGEELRKVAQPSAEYRTRGARRGKKR